MFYIKYKNNYLCNFNLCREDFHLSFDNDFKRAIPFVSFNHLCYFLTLANLYFDFNKEGLYCVNENQESVKIF